MNDANTQKRMMVKIQGDEGLVYYAEGLTDEQWERYAIHDQGYSLWRLDKEDMLGGKARLKEKIEAHICRLGNTTDERELQDMADCKSMLELIDTCSWPPEDEINEMKPAHGWEKRTSDVR